MDDMPLDETVHKGTTASDFCRTCHGKGYDIIGGDSVPYGSTNVSLPDYEEPCEDCIGQGKCPSCGRVIMPTTVTNNDQWEVWVKNLKQCPNEDCGWQPDWSDIL